MPTDERIVELLRLSLESVCGALGHADTMTAADWDEVAYILQESHALSVGMAMQRALRAMRERGGSTPT